MLKRLSLSAALLVAFALAPSTADAKPHKHHKHGRGHAYAYGRRNRVTDARFDRDDRHDRDGNNRWRGVSRGSLGSHTTPSTFPEGEGRALGRRIEDRNKGKGHGHGKH